MKNLTREMNKSGNLPGFLIAFEGIDGAGKTTQARLLTEWLESCGVIATLTREPSDSIWGLKISNIAKKGRAGTSLDEEISYFIEDRKLHVKKVVAPALIKGCVVISDRYYYSNIAYQGALGADIAVVRRLNEKDHRFPRPDVVFYLDIAPNVAINRINRNRGGANTGYERADYLKKVKAIFDSFTDSNIKKIKGTLKRDEIERIVRNTVKEMMGL